MKKITIAIAIFTVMAMVSGSAFAATTLTVGETGKTYGAGPGETVDVPIVVSSLAGIAGFAFTVTHGTLEVTAVTSGKGVIDTFSDLGYDDRAGLIDGKVDTYSTPLVFNNVTAGQTKIAAAVPNALTGTASAFLCTVTFKVPATAADTDTFPVKIIPTNLKNEAAGYAATGEDIPVIITDDATYSTLLSAADLKTAAPAGTVIVDAGMKGDANGDGRITTADALLVVQVALKKAGKTEADLQNDCDVNVAGGDAKITTADALTIVRFALKKITTWP